MIIIMMTLIKRVVCNYYRRQSVNHWLMWLDSIFERISSLIWFVIILMTPVEEKRVKSWYKRWQKMMTLLNCLIPLPSIHPIQWKDRDRVNVCFIRRGRGGEKNNVCSISTKRWFKSKERKKSTKCTTFCVSLNTSSRTWRGKVLDWVDCLPLNVCLHLYLTPRMGTKISFSMSTISWLRTHTKSWQEEQKWTTRQ